MRGDKRPKENGNGFRTPTGVRCGIYTRKSTDEGLDQAFNTLDAQREAAESFISSQRQEGWWALPQKYDDGGYVRDHSSGFGRRTARVSGKARAAGADTRRPASRLCFDGQLPFQPAGSGGVARGGQSAR